MNPIASVSSAVPNSDALATNADLGGAEADGRQIGRQNDDGEAVAKAAHAARGIEQQNVGMC